MYVNTLNNTEENLMDNSILISIIVPAYNVEQWIERCLESIQNQSYKNLEIIVIDDGSKDKTPAL